MAASILGDVMVGVKVPIEPCCVVVCVRAARLQEVLFSELPVGLVIAQSNLRPTPD